MPCAAAAMYAARKEYFWNRIITLAAERITARNPPCGQQWADQRAMLLERLQSIGRAAWFKAAGWRQPGRNNQLIAPDQQQKYKTDWIHNQFSTLDTLNFLMPRKGTCWSWQQMSPLPISRRRAPVPSLNLVINHRTYDAMFLPWQLPHSHALASRSPA